MQPEKDNRTPAMVWVLLGIAVFFFAAVKAMEGYYAAPAPKVEVTP